MDSYQRIEWIWRVFLAIVLMAMVAGLLLGCTPNPCIKPVVDLPEPVLPVVGATDLWCLTDDAYLRLAERDIALQSALRECRAVVDELTEQP